MNSMLEKVLTIKQNFTGSRKPIPDNWLAEFAFTPTVGEVRAATVELAQLHARIAELEKKLKEALEDEREL